MTSMMTKDFVVFKSLNKTTLPEKTEDYFHILRLSSDRLVMVIFFE